MPSRASPHLGPQYCQAHIIRCHTNVCGPRLRVPLRFTTSREGPPYLQLIQEVPGSPWVAGPSPVIDHIGYWVADLAASATAPARRGLPVEVTYAAEDGPRSFTCHRGPANLRIELVDEARREPFEAWARGDRPPELRAGSTPGGDDEDLADAG